MRDAIFHKQSGRHWTNMLGSRNSAVEMSIYEPNRFTGNARYDIFVSSTAGYTVFKFKEDLVELRQFCDEAIQFLEAQDKVIDGKVAKRDRIKMSEMNENETD